MNSLRIVLFCVAVSGLVAGLAAPFLGVAEHQSAIWGISAAAVLLFLLRDILTSLFRGEVGLDLVAALSMSAAIGFGETLAASVVAVMYAGGQLLEGFAAGRAQADMRALLARAPHTAQRYEGDTLREIAIDDVRPGDRLLIRQGDVVPVDGRVRQGRALMDMSALTGESAPLTRVEGQELRSGARSLDGAFEMTASRPATESAYAGIVRLVKAAQDSKAPMARLADRFALWFLLLTVLIAGAAYLASGDPVRMLAVLVVATPCPLILAVPVAIISGMGKAARRGVLMKGGPVLEAMARATSLVIDKTGTITRGKAELADTIRTGSVDEAEMLRLAASLEQASGHVIGQSIVDAAVARGLPLGRPGEVHEQAGEGLTGLVDGRRVVVGGRSYVQRMLKLDVFDRPETAPGAVLAAVGVDGEAAGFLVLADGLREEAPRAIARLRTAGIGRIVLASGDSQTVVDRVAGALGFESLRGGLSPEDKVDVVREERRHGVTLMVGDGVNDAPALAAADVGISMGVRGSAAATETADAVLLVDNIERLAEAVETARRSRVIALQSVYAGLGLSTLGMVAAAFGYLPPVQGALMQEAIDVAVILNALRALR